MCRIPGNVLKCRFQGPVAKVPDALVLGWGPESRCISTSTSGDADTGCLKTTLKMWKMGQGASWFLLTGWGGNESRRRMTTLMYLLC